MTERLFRLADEYGDEVRAELLHDRVEIVTTADDVEVYLDADAAERLAAWLLDAARQLRTPEVTG